MRGKAQQTIILSPRGKLIFDDTVLDKNHSQVIAGTRSQWSGSSHQVVTGIGVANCLYYNPDVNQFWVVDYRIFDPDRDGKTKLDHVEEILKLAMKRQISFDTVLMDSWHATTAMMLRMHHFGKTFYCPLKANRLVDDSGGQRPYQAVATLSWTQAELNHGKVVKVKKFPGSFKLKLFRVTVNSDRTEYVVTNNLAQDSLIETQKESATRWTIEQLHREEKQFTGIEKCQTRLNRSQRNHICLATLVWLVLKETAKATGKTIYQQKREPLIQFMAQQWRNPATVFAL